MKHTKPLAVLLLTAISSTTTYAHETTGFQTALTVTTLDGTDHHTGSENKIRIDWTYFKVPTEKASLLSKLKPSFNFKYTGFYLMNKTFATISRSITTGLTPPPEEQDAEWLESKKDLERLTNDFEQKANAIVNPSVQKIIPPEFYDTLSDTVTQRMTLKKSKNSIILHINDDVIPSGNTFITPDHLRIVDFKNFSKNKTFVIKNFYCENATENCPDYEIEKYRVTGKNSIHLTKVVVGSNPTSNPKPYKIEEKVIYKKGLNDPYPVKEINSVPVYKHSSDLTADEIEYLFIDMDFSFNN